MKGILGLLLAASTAAVSSATGPTLVDAAPPPVRWKFTENSNMTYPSGPLRSPGTRQRKRRKAARRGGRRA